MPLVGFLDFLSYSLSIRVVTPWTAANGSIKIKYLIGMFVIDLFNENAINAGSA